MTLSLESWELFLRDSGVAAAIPLLIAGVGMMFFGWRLWRLCVVCSFAVMGGAVFMSTFGSGVAGAGDWLYALIGGVLFGAVSYWPARYLVAILGGVVASVAAMYYLQAIGLRGGAEYALCAAVWIAGTAYAFLNRRHVVVLLTSFLGAAAFLSGIVAIMTTVPAVNGVYRSLTSYSAFVGPFLLLVPMVMSAFYQIAEMRKMNTKF